MTKPHYETQIQRKITLLERERNQVLKHLAVLDEKLETLNKALVVMNDVDDKRAAYLLYRRAFKGKLRKMLIEVLKGQPEHYFTVNELVLAVLEKDGQPPKIKAQHTNSMRGALKALLDKGIVERKANNVIDVKWRLNRL